MIMSATSDETIAPKAAPMMTPTAKSTTLPRSANFLNSSSMVGLLNCQPFTMRECELLKLEPQGRGPGCRVGKGASQTCMACQSHGAAPCPRGEIEPDDGRTRGHGAR